MLISTEVHIRNHLLEVRNINISEWPVWRRLYSAKLSSRTRATSPPLTRVHRVARLGFCSQTPQTYIVLYMTFLGDEAKCRYIWQYICKITQGRMLKIHKKHL